MEKEKKREDLYAATTDRKGIGGFLEIFLRKFRMVSFIIALFPIYIVTTLAMGISISPGILFFDFISDYSSSWPTALHYIAMGFGISFGYFISRTLPPA